MLELRQIDARRGCPARLTVFRDDVGEDAAAHVELGGQPHEPGLRRGDEVVQDAVGHRFVKGAFIAEGPDVELEAFQFHAFLVGDVIQIERGEIRLPGLGAQAGEFGDFHVDVKIAPGLRIVEGFEGFAGLTRHGASRINRVPDYTTLMRLTHLKLAGFKSFVDPTTLHLHGQRVGVVGPNGCGKSNVMESIRWVLGESSAKEMRGDSMQDVIFNGSGNRKPVSRASVELLFDNSLGGASGAWSQYAEISVKRVLHRDGGSDYFINNTKVRRRDVADLFLGTGLGGRAYAIIGQNTISRIVEARPEELRVFLEEAAGISRYKERRRETELRLRDTRENLVRVEDIRRELDKQIVRLEAQAEVARQYHQLKEMLGVAQGQFWLLKKRDAALAWEKARRQVERQANDLEAQTAALRKAEGALEQLRLEHYAGGEAVQHAQGRYYETGAQVSSLEQALRHARENRDRLAAQLAQVAAEQAGAFARRQSLEQQLADQQGRRQQAEADSAAAGQALEAARQALPAAEQSQRDAQAAFGQVQSAIQQAEHQIHLENTGIGHARKMLDEHARRLQRIADEERQLLAPDTALIKTRTAEADALQAQLTGLEGDLAGLIDAEQAQAARFKTLQHEVQEAAHRQARSEAQFSALQKLQQTLGQEGKLDAWLGRYRIDGGHRLWQCIQVESGLETALEGLLGARLNALLAGGLAAPERPPAAVVLMQEGGAEPEVSGMHAAGWKPLAGCVRVVDARVAGALDDWLAGAWLLPEGEDPDSARARLSAGEVLVTRRGDVATRHSLSLYAPQNSLHGVLERQRELDQLAQMLPALQAARERLESGQREAEQHLHAMRRAIADAQQRQRQMTATYHGLRMETQRLQQQLQHALDRRRQLSEDEKLLSEQRVAEEIQLSARSEAVRNLQASLAALRAQRDQAGQQRQAADHALMAARNGLMEMERKVQQQAFSLQLVSNNINELKNNIRAIDESMLGLQARHAEILAQQAQASDDDVKSGLEQALAERHAAEQALTEARNALADIEQRLQGMERGRLQAEQQLHPMRDKLEQARLQEQQARLQFEHCTAQLLATGLDEAVLTATLEPGAKAGDLESRGRDLQSKIDVLGAVNLAAIHEVAVERERKVYLDSQAQDLEQAIATLEDAIQRIDRETRSRLQQTYDEANRNFNELFQTLFGGGQAQLQLLGDEILDTGMQVFAQPPGKKNSTIHLLSGGEKALTAIALVFALFRLNPAPFCLMDEVDAPLDDSNTERFCALVRKMSERTQFMFVSHNKITMEMAQQLIGVTMQESGVSRIVEVDMEAALRMQTEAVA